jgi:diguanylate cyclase (GGDEF)-like protein
MSSDPQASAPTLRSAEFAYAATLFGLATGLVAWFATASDIPMGANPVWLMLFFLVFGLFTIATGYRHPQVGYVSFDRIAQIASILVLGPLPAAMVNGLASLLYPWQRLRQGQSWQRVLSASLHNAGLMALLTLVCGGFYVWVGGAIPLPALEPRSMLALLVLLLSMQILNDLAMLLDSWIARSGLYWPFNPFIFAVEGAASLGAVFVAIVFNRMEPAVILLMLVVLAIGLVALTQFARMRVRLEEMVSERTMRLREQAHELERQATHDQLTGLFNRRFADRFMAEGIKDFHLQGRTFALALVDLDHFKMINDAHSHQVGDEVLQRVSRLLAQDVRATDMVARFGGEEFLLCFPNTDLQSAARACEHLRETVENTDWSDLSPALRVTLCAGVAQMRPGFDRDRLLREADKRLYEAKRSGRNRVAVDLAS